MNTYDLGKIFDHKLGENIPCNECFIESIREELCTLQKLKDENFNEFTDECKARYGELCRECFLRWIRLDDICNPLQC